MSPEAETLAAVIAILDRRGVPYMITGSLAASHHGTPRATHDADLVIDPTTEQLDALVLDFEAGGFYVDPAGARDALMHRRQFNVIEMGHACKVDLIIRKDRAFSREREEFARRQTVDLGLGRPLSMVTPEDAIVSKLEWASRGDSERQLRDARGILEINPDLDRQYISRWADQLGVAHLEGHREPGMSSRMD